jgi:hypothetical protein
MPKHNIDYSKTIIYKFVCKDIKIEDIYIGSTSDFTRRKYNHKCACINQQNTAYNLKIYKIIRDNGGWINWEMIEIEKYPCNDSNEARARERYWYEFLNASLNSNKPIQYHDELIKYRKEYDKEYQKNNVDEIKEYRKKNEIKLREYYKEYQKKNESKLKEYNKKYYNKNKKMK